MWSTKLPRSWCASAGECRMRSSGSGSEGLWERGREHGSPDGWAGRRKLETRRIKRRGIWVLFTEPVWGGVRAGVGAETYSTCPETQDHGSHYPSAAPTSVNLIQENNAGQGRVAGGASGVKGGSEDNISGK